MSPSQGNHESALHLMVQSPTSLFVYWQMTADFVDLATSGLNDVSPGLKLRLLRENNADVETVSELFLADTQYRGSIYFYDQRPQSRYFAELGISFKGGYFTLLRSVRILLPPAGQIGAALAYKEGDWPVSLPPTLPFAYSPVEASQGRGGY